MGLHEEAGTHRRGGTVYPTSVGNPPLSRGGGCQMALKELAPRAAEKQVLVLDDERKAAMVSNLMVVLCGESEVHPVQNTGTLYT